MEASIYITALKKDRKPFKNTDQQPKASPGFSSSMSASAAAGTSIVLREWAGAPVSQGKINFKGSSILVEGFLRLFKSLLKAFYIKGVLSFLKACYIRAF